MPMDTLNNKLNHMKSKFLLVKVSWTWWFTWFSLFLLKFPQLEASLSFEYNMPYWCLKSIINKKKTMLSDRGKCKDKVEYMFINKFLRKPYNYGRSLVTFHLIPRAGIYSPHDSTLLIKWTTGWGRALQLLPVSFNSICLESFSKTSATVLGNFV